MSLLKAGFVNQTDAINYKQMLKAVNRTAGYNDLIFFHSPLANKKGFTIYVPLYSVLKSIPDSTHLRIYRRYKL